MKNKKKSKHNISLRDGDNKEKYPLRISTNNNKFNEENKNEGCLTPIKQESMNGDSEINRESISDY